MSTPPTASTRRGQPRPVGGDGEVIDGTAVPPRPVEPLAAKLTSGIASKPRSDVHPRSDVDQRNASQPRLELPCQLLRLRLWLRLLLLRLR